MRLISPLGLLLIAAFATASIGQPLMGEGGKFSVSNITPVLFCAVALPLFMTQRKTVDRRIIWFFLAFNATSLLSFAIFAVRFGWEPNFLVLLFQDIEILFGLLLVWYGESHPDEFRAVVRAGIYGSLAVGACLAWFESKDGLVEISFGMDDKSHAAVLFCCEAYILVRFFGGKLDHLVAVALIGAGLLTVSREPVLILPSILFAIAVRSRGGLAIASFLVCGVIVAFAVAGDAILETFTALNRLTSLDRVTGEASTAVHFLLIQSSLEMKFADPGCFFFGIGPGNFSKALASFQVLLPEIRAVDPALASAALEGRAPMHSVPVSLLLDMNIGLFFVCAFLFLKALGYLLRTRNAVDLVFVLCFLAASTFYSLHNKPYFFMIVATVVVLVRQQPAAARSPSAAWAERPPKQALP